MDLGLDFSDVSCSQKGHLWSIQMQLRNFRLRKTQIDSIFPMGAAAKEYWALEENPEAWQVKRQRPSPVC